MISEIPTHAKMFFLKQMLMKYLCAGWISVTEKIPEHENNLLAVLDGQVCIMNYFSSQS